MFSMHDITMLPLRWRHNGRDSVSNHQSHHCYSTVYSVSDADHRTNYSIHVPGWLQKWLNLITAPGSVSNEPGSVTWLATKYLKTVSWRNHTETSTTWWPQNISFWPKINIPSSYFTILMLNCLEKYSQTPVRQLCDSCQIFDLIYFKTTSIWLDLPTLLESVWILSWNTVKLLTGMLKSLHSLGSCAENFLLIQISSILSVIFTRLWLKCQRMFWWASCTSARHAGSFDCLMTSLILITMDNGRGHCAYWQSCKVLNQTHTGIKKN